MSGLRRRAHQWLAAIGLYGVLLLLGTVSLVWNLLAVPLYWLLPASAGRHIGRAVIAHAYGTIWRLSGALHLLRVDAGCLDRLRHEPGLIIVANHPSMFDALLMVAHLPRSACIMKAALMRNVFLGAGARLARYIRNDSARTMVREAVRDLQRGGQLVMFPEGTRTTDWPVNPFKPGVTLIAKLARAPIQTVLLETNSPYLTKGWPIWRLPPLPITYRLQLGQRFAPADDSDALLVQLEQYFRQHSQAHPAHAPAPCPTPRAPTLS